MWSPSVSEGGCGDFSPPVDYWWMFRFPIIFSKKNLRLWCDILVVTCYVVNCLLAYGKRQTILLHKIAPIAHLSWRTLLLRWTVSKSRCDTISIFVWSIYYKKEKNGRQNKALVTNRLIQEGDVFFHRLLSPPGFTCVGKKEMEEGDTYYSMVNLTSLPPPPLACMLHPFLPSISLIFHSAWLVPWQGEIGWDDSQRGGKVMGCIVKTSLPTLPLSSSSSFHLVLLPFLIFCLPLHLFPYSYTVSCLSVLLFLFLHLSHLSFLLAMRNEELFTGRGYREERKRERKRRTACTIITCFSSVFSSSLCFAFQSDFYPPVSENPWVS